MTNQSPELDTVFHALADPTRRAVVQRLAGGAASVKELAAPFSMALPSFLQHVRVLEDAGLITTQKSGRTRTCEIAPRRLGEARTWLAEQVSVWEDRLDRFDAYVKDLAARDETP